MTPSSSFNCPACGTPNPPQVAHCLACGHLFPASAADTILAPALSASQPAPPALLAGRYRILGMVGTGGFGAVYQAEDVQRHDALVAIKEINLGGLSPQEVIEATETFTREVRFLSGLHHPNLPRIYEHFTDAEHWYLAMDFIEGQTLQEYLKHSTRTYLPVAEVLDIGIQLCTVLHYLHTRQPPIIFREVSPANIMRTPSGQLFLIDFGIARHFTPGRARDTSALGSPGYAAPEQYGNAQTTVHSDIYSLGVTLQTLLTGKDPLEPVFGYASPYAEDQNVPAALDLLLGQMCDADADQRPRSMEAVKQVLQGIQEPSLLKGSTTQQPAPGSGSALVTGQQTPAPLPKPPAMTRLSKTHISALIVLVFLLIASAFGLSYLLHANQLAASRLTATATTNAASQTATASTSSRQSPPIASPNTTATAQTNATTQANATATVVTASATFSPPQRGKLVLNDPLRDNSLGYHWDENANCQFAGGAYRVKSPGLASFDCYAQATDFGNFAFQVQMTIPQDGSGGISFRVDQNQGGGYTFVIDGGGSYILFCSSSNTSDCSFVLASGRSPSFHPGFNQVNMLAVVAQGSSITIYVNGHFLLSLQDSTSSHGHIGVSFLGSGEVEYRNAKVWTL